MHATICLASVHVYKAYVKIIQDLKRLRNEAFSVILFGPIYAPNRILAWCLACLSKQQCS